MCKNINFICNPFICANIFLYIHINLINYSSIKLVKKKKKSLKAQIKKLDDIDTIKPSHNYSTKR